MSTEPFQKIIFHYTPNKALSYFFIIVFGLGAIVHIVLGYRYRRFRYLIWTAGLCGVFDVVGWVGRLLGATDPESTSLIPYILNALFTLFAPTFLLAANFMLLRDVMAQLGACYSRLNPRLYGKIFVTCDVISLLIQSGGGGLSATQDANTVKIGGDISLVGIVFQLVGLLVYMVLGVEYFWRYSRNAPFAKKPMDDYYRGVFTPRVRKMVLSLSVVTVLILVRSVYRSVELAGGYDGKVASTQWLFVVFDAVLVALALWTLIFLHPGWLLLESEAQSVSVLVGTDGRTSSGQYDSGHELKPTTV